MCVLLQSIARLENRWLGHTLPPQHVLECLSRDLKSWAEEIVKAKTSCCASKALQNDWEFDFLDTLTPWQRTILMGKVRSRDTQPETIVASLLRSLRYRVIKHDSTLSGKPDFYLPRCRVIIFVHGCFWHRHNCRRGRSTPSTRAAFWKRKFAKNKARDRKVRAMLRRLKIRVLVLWECQLQYPIQIRTRIRAFVNSKHPIA